MCLELVHLALFRTSVAEDLCCICHARFVFCSEMTECFVSRVPDRNIFPTFSPVAASCRLPPLNCRLPDAAAEVAACRMLLLKLLLAAAVLACVLATWTRPPLLPPLAAAEVAACRMPLLKLPLAAKACVCLPLDQPPLLLASCRCCLPLAACHCCRLRLPLLAACACRFAGRRCCLPLAVRVPTLAPPLPTLAAAVLATCPCCCCCCPLLLLPCVHGVRLSVRIAVCLHSPRSLPLLMLTSPLLLRVGWGPPPPPPQPPPPPPPAPPPSTTKRRRSPSRAPQGTGRRASARGRQGRGRLAPCGLQTKHRHTHPPSLRDARSRVDECAAVHAGNSKRPMSRRRMMRGRRSSRRDGGRGQHRHRCSEQSAREGPR